MFSDASVSGDTQARGCGLIVEHLRERPGEGVDIVGVVKTCGVVDDFGDRSGSRRHDGSVGHHGFEERKAESLVQTRIRQDRSILKQPVPGVVVDPPGHMDPGHKIRAECCDRFGDGAGIVARRSGDDEMEIGSIRRDRPKGMNETHQVLAPFDGAEREHEASGSQVLDSSGDSFDEGSGRGSAQGDDGDADLTEEFAHPVRGGLGGGVDEGSGRNRPA
jgi:hypothetical protein